MVSQDMWARLGSFRNDIAVWGTAFLLSIAQERHVVYFFGNLDMSDLIRTIQAERGVLAGYPHWRYFQSRLLGPWIEKLLNILFGFNFLIAHMIVAVAVLTLTSFLMFEAGRSIGGRQYGWSALLAFQAVFTLMMSRPWLYIWDYFILLVGVAFLLLVIRRAPWWSFLLLMSVGFVNHETALFIGVWMIAQASVDAWARREAPDWRLLAGGVLGSIGGIVFIEFLRNSLLKREIGWGLFNDISKDSTSQFDAYFHVQIASNLHDMYQWMTHPNYDLFILIPIPLIIVLGFALMLILRYGLRAGSLSIYALAQVAALLLFGLRTETRNLLQVLPFLCLGGMLVAKREWLWGAQSTMADAADSLAIRVRSRSAERESTKPNFGRYALSSASSVSSMASSVSGSVGVSAAERQQK